MGCSAPESIHQELEHFVRAGLTPYEALERATRIPAEFMRTDDEVGTVAPGMRADLLLLESNPLEGVGTLRSPVGVSLRGNWLEAGELAAILAEVREEIEAAGR